MVGDSRRKLFRCTRIRVVRAAARRAAQRADATRQHPRCCRTRVPVPPRRNLLRSSVTSTEAGFRRGWRRCGCAERTRAAHFDCGRFPSKRLTGDYRVDEFGFDPQFNNAIVLPLLRFFFQNWFRVEVSGIENLPESGAVSWLLTTRALCRSTA